MNFILTVLNKAVDEFLQFSKSKNSPRNFAIILSAAFFAYFIEYLLSSVGSFTMSILAGLINFLAYILILTITLYLIKRDRVLRGENELSATFNIKGLLTYLKANLITVIFATALSAIWIVVGFIFLILPGIYLLVKLLLVPYIAQDQDRETQSDSLTYSFHLTKNYFWQCLVLAALLGFVYLFGVSLLLITIDVNFIFYPLFNSLFTLISVFLLFCTYEVLKVEDEGEKI